MCIKFKDYIYLYILLSERKEEPKSINGWFGVARITQDHLQCHHSIERVYYLLYINLSTFHRNPYVSILYTVYSIQRVMSELSINEINDFIRIAAYMLD